MNPTLTDAETLRSWMTSYIAAVLDLDQDTVATNVSFDSYGMDSVEAVIMAGVMEEEFSIRIDPTMVFEDPSIDGLVKALQGAGLVR